jgi:hypothetical protein
MSSGHERPAQGAVEGPRDEAKGGLKIPLVHTLLKGVIETGADVLGSTLGQELKRELEARDLSTGELLRKTLEQGVSRGVEVLDQTEELRRSLQVSRAELVERVSLKMDGYKAEGVELARAELRRLLDRIDLNHELQALLSQFSVVVTTEIRFAPTDDGSGVKPVVKTSAQVKRDPAPPADEGEA